MCTVLALAVVVGASHLLAQRSATARAIAWMESDIGDQARFPSRVVAAGPAAPLRTGAEPEQLDAPVSRMGVGVPLDEFLEDSGTHAFLVVQGDRLVYERYFHGSSRETRETSFSAAKSFVSTLVGIAIDEGLIGGVDDPVTTYLPELAERDERFSRITLRHLLTMSSGIRYVENGMPWSDDAVTYYGVDLRELALADTEIERAPNEEWRYNNYHPLLLGLVLERATGMRVSEYMSSRLWQPLGAEEDATWSLDSERSGFEKMESGINALAVDYARFGLMMLHDGTWNGRRILSSEWVREATALDTESDPADFYQYLWWVQPSAGSERDPFFAMGKYGQLVGVFPDQDVVIVRLGSSAGEVDWQAFLARLVDRLD